MLGRVVFGAGVRLSPKYFLSLSLSLDDLIMCNSSATVAAVLCFVADGYLTVSENT